MQRFAKVTSILFATILFNFARKIALRQASRPLGSLAEVWKLRGNVGAQASIEGDVFVQDAKSVFAHLRATEEFGRFFGEIQTELKRPGRDRNADVEVAEKEAPMAVSDSAARVEKPSHRSGGIDVQKLKQLFLEIPEPQNSILGNADSVEVRDDSKEGEVGRGIGSALKGREFEPTLDSGDDHRRAVKRFR